MTISHLDTSESGRVLGVYNAHATEIPYEYPVDEETFVEAVSRPSDDFTDGGLLVIEEEGQPRGFVHCGTIAENDSEKSGLIRYLCFPRDDRRIGQALLDHAHAYLDELGLTAYQAFNYKFSYPCT